MQGNADTDSLPISYSGTRNFQKDKPLQQSKRTVEESRSFVGDVIDTDRQLTILQISGIEDVSV